MCETSFYIREKLQIKGTCKVGAEENRCVSGKECKKCDYSYIMKNFIIWTLHKYIWDDEIKMTWAGQVVHTKDMITEYEILFGKAEGKKVFGRCVYRNMILKSIRNKKK